MKKRILCIDASVMNWAGWCLIDLTLAEDGKTILEEGWDWGAWEISGMNFMMRCVDLKDYVTMHIKEFDELVCEWPMFYEGQKGQTAARQGYTINLAGIAMYLAGWFQCTHKNLTLYTAPDWKGSVSKAVTARKFFKTFGVDPNTVDHNAIDATMMGVYHLQQQKYKT